MNIRIAGSLVLVLAGSVALAGGWTTNAYRTLSGDLVPRGDTMTQVLKSAGNPADRRVISYGITLGNVVGLNRELWTYRGTDGIYTITFVGDSVQQIDVLPFR